MKYYRANSKVHVICIQHILILENRVATLSEAVTKEEYALNPVENLTLTHRKLHTSDLLIKNENSQV
jgi:hypothetical protein